MKIKTTSALSVVLFGTAWAASAGSWSVSIGFGGPAYYPAPVMVAPAYYPPPVYCPPPPRIVYAPPVAYCPPRPVCPPPVYYAPPGHAWGHYKHGKGSDRYGYDSRGRDDRGGHQRDWQAGRR